MGCEADVNQGRWPRACRNHQQNLVPLALKRNRFGGRGACPVAGAQTIIPVALMRSRGRSVGPLLLESGLNFLDRAISDFFRHVDAGAGLQPHEPPEEGNEALGVIHGRRWR